MITYRLFTKRRMSSRWRLAGTYHALQSANNRLAYLAGRGDHVGLRVDRYEITRMTTWGVEY